MVMEPLVVLTTLSIQLVASSFQSLRYWSLCGLGGGSPIKITNGGKQIHEGIYGGWETLAAAEIDGINTVLGRIKLPTACILGGLIAIGTASAAMTGSIPILRMLLPLKPTSTSI